MSSEGVSTPQQRTPDQVSQAERFWNVFLVPTWRDHRRAFSLSLTTTVFSQRSTGWFDAHPRRADAGGPTILHLSHSSAYVRGLLHNSSFSGGRPAFCVGGFLVNG